MVSTSFTILQHETYKFGFLNIFMKYIQCFASSRSRAQRLVLAWLIIKHENLCKDLNCAKPLSAHSLISFSLPLSLSLHRTVRKLSCLHFIYGPWAVKLAQTAQKSNNGMQFKCNCFMHNNSKHTKAHKHTPKHTQARTEQQKVAFHAALTSRRAALANVAYAQHADGKKLQPQQQQQQHVYYTVAPLALINY